MSEEYKREYKTILSIIEDIAPDENIGNINPTIRLRDQLDLDSMDFLDIVMELRKQYQIEVPEEHYSYLSTLDSGAKYVFEKKKDASFTPNYSAPKFE